MRIRYGIPLVFVATLLYLSSAVAQDAPPDWLLKDGICPVSKLKAREHPEWTICYQDKEGNWRAFVGITSFLDFVNHSEKYVGKRIRHGGTVLVREHGSSKWLQALFAYFVYGPDIVGPVGRDVYAFESEKDAKKWTSKHNAMGVVRFVALQRSVLAYLKNVEMDSTESDSVIIPKVIDVRKTEPLTR